MNPKMIKTLMTIVTFLSIIILSTSTVLADPGFTPGQLNGSTPNQSEDMKNLGNKIIGILQTVGVVLSVVILIVLGIKYMMGSAEEKAEYKKTMIPYLIGAVFIFLAPTIANVIYSMITNK